MRYSMQKALALLVLCFVSLLGSAKYGLAAEDEISLVSAEEAIILSGNEMIENRGAFRINSLASEQSLAAETTGNSLNVYGNLANGNIALGDNVGGFGSYVMNTGNNSTINSAVSVNVQLAPVSP